MINNLEKRLQQLENQVKDLKATYAVAGGNVRMYVTRQSFNVSISSNTTKKVKFTPTYGLGRIMMATMSGKATYTSGTGLVQNWGAHQAIQDGSGEVILEFPFVNYSSGTLNYRLDVVISATSPGTLALI